MEKRKEHPWIKLKRYPHIGFPLERSDIPKLENYITDENKIAKHSFLPFLHRTILQRKFRANKLGKRNKSKRRTRELSKKAREIYFASHYDAQIYSYYSYLLSEKYNDLLKSKSFDKSIVAYRKLESKGQKININATLILLMKLFNSSRKIKKQIKPLLLLILPNSLTA